MLRLKRKQAKTKERLKKIQDEAVNNLFENVYYQNENSNKGSTTSKNNDFSINNNEDNKLSRKGEDFELTKHGNFELPLGTLKWDDSKEPNDNNIIDYNKFSPLLDIVEITEAISGTYQLSYTNLLSQRQNNFNFLGFQEFRNIPAYPRILWWHKQNNQQQRRLTSYNQHYALYPKKETPFILGD